LFDIQTFELAYIQRAIKNPFCGKAERANSLAFSFGFNPNISNDRDILPARITIFPGRLTGKR
jgi:hypothetical protein